MAIDPKEVKSIEDSMVHDIDEEPKPEGMGVYMTLRFLSEVLLGVYGVMLLGMVMVQIDVLSHGERIPVFLMPESVLLGLPIALVAVYFYFVSDHEPDIVKLRTLPGKVITFVITFSGHAQWSARSFGWRSPKPSAFTNLRLHVLRPKPDAHESGGNSLQKWKAAVKL